MKVRQHEAQLLDDCPHRPGFDTCPECGKRSKYEDWRKPKYVGHVILDPQKYSKRSSCIVISYCPKCGERSWVHEELEMSSLYSDTAFNKIVRKKLQKEKIRRIRLAVTQMAESPCMTCPHVTDMSFHYLYFQVDRRRGTFMSNGGPCKGKCELEN